LGRRRGKIGERGVQHQGKEAFGEEGASWGGEERVIAKEEQP